MPVKTKGNVSVSVDGMRKLKRSKYAIHIEMKQINKSIRKIIQTGVLRLPIDMNAKIENLQFSIRFASLL